MEILQNIRYLIDFYAYVIMVANNYYGHEYPYPIDLHN